MVFWTRSVAVVWVVVVLKRWGAMGGSAGEMGDVGHLGVGGVQKASLCCQRYYGVARILPQ